MEVKKIPAQAKLKLETARSKSSVLDITLQTFKDFSLSDGGTHSAALTYFIFFSIFPMLLFAGAFLGYITFGNQELQDKIFDAAVDSVPLIRDILSPAGLEFLGSRRQELAITALILALYSGTGAIVALEHALNKIHGVVEESNWIGKRVTALKWLVVFGVAGILSLALGVGSAWATDIFDGSTASVLGWVLGHLTGLLVGVFIFATAYRFLPDRDFEWSEVLPGAVMAAILFELLKEFGSWYLSQGAGSREAAFGVFASAAGLLIAAYLLSQMILLSAQLNGVLADRRLTRQSTVTEAKEGQDV